MSADVSARSHNGKTMTSVTGHTSTVSPAETLVWAMLALATEDVAHLARRRIIDTDGWCAPWPMESHLGADGCVRTRPKMVVGMRHADDAISVRHFFVNGAAQEWGDLVGLRIPATEVFYKTLKTHAPQ